MKSSSVTGVARSNVTSAANIADATTIATSTTIRKRRLSTMSAKTPADSANRNIGKLVATWTSDTINGCVVRLVISHAAAALYIQVPTLATTVAVQITANVR